METILIQKLFMHKATLFTPTSVIGSQYKILMVMALDLVTTVAVCTKFHTTTN